jgi:RNA polymerase sigma factor (sigma-70 family)
MTSIMASSPRSARHAFLGDPALRRSLAAMVRRRVPPGEVEDVVQSTLTDAVAAATGPENDDELRRWVWGIARHKIADAHRKARREAPAELPELEAPSEADHEERDLLRWAERELPSHEAKQTLGWLLREGEGEKLETIAEREQIPAPTVRQRVTRLRKHFRTRWEAQLAAVATLVGAIALIWWWLQPREQPVPPIVREVPSATPLDQDPSLLRARELRRLALQQCHDGAYVPCLEGLDQAKTLDPAGDGDPAIVEARQAAGRALAVPSGAIPNTTAPDPTPTAPQLPKQAPTTSPPPSVFSPNGDASTAPRVPTPSSAFPSVLAPPTAPSPTSAPPPVSSGGTTPTRPMAKDNSGFSDSGGNTGSKKPAGKAAGKNPDSSRK